MSSFSGKWPHGQWAWLSARPEIQGCLRQLGGLLVTRAPTVGAAGLGEGCTKSGPVEPGALWTGDWVGEGLQGAVQFPVVLICTSMLGAERRILRAAVQTLTRWRAGVRKGAGLREVDVYGTRPDGRGRGGNGQGLTPQPGAA